MNSDTDKTHTTFVDIIFSSEIILMLKYSTLCSDPKFD
jgi:hypothetical protein